MVRAERGMHDLNETAIEDLIRLMEQAVGHGEERNAIIDRVGRRTGYAERMAAPHGGAQAVQRDAQTGGGHVDRRTGGRRAGTDTGTAGRPHGATHTTPSTSAVGGR